MCVCVCVSVCVSVCVRERETGRQTFFWLAGGEVNGWYSKNLSHQPSGFCRRILRYVPNSVLYMYIAIPWGGLRTLPHGYTIISWLPFLCFCIPSLCSLVTAWICSLVLREDLGGWSLFPTNEKKGTQAFALGRAMQDPAWLHRHPYFSHYRFACLAFIAM